MTTNERLTKEEERFLGTYLKEHGVEPGETTRLSHDACGDRRNRLYVTVHSDRSAVAWCHNCQKYGVVPAKRGPRIRPKASTEVPKEAAKVTSVNELGLMAGVIDDAARTWLNNFPLFRDDIWHAQSYSMETSAIFNYRLHIPIYDDNSTWADKDIVGGQLRQVYEGGPKYFTWRKDQSDGLQNIIGPGGGKEVLQAIASDRLLVITEDVLSALAVLFTHENVLSLPLLGLNILPSTLMKIKHYGIQNILIWLDNDVAEARQAANRIAAMLRTMGVPNVQVCYDPEPKLCTLEEIRRNVERSRTVEVVKEA